VINNSETELYKVKEVPIVFILGHGRSGTTLLQSILNGHPNISAPPEYDFIIYLYPLFRKIKHWEKADILAFIDALFSDPYFSIWLINREVLTEKLLPVAGHVDFPALCKILIRLTKEHKEDIKMLLDKNPINTIFTGKLMELFPDAKFIHMIRDPRDSVDGHIKRLKSKNPFFLSRRWNRYNAILENFKQKYPDKFFTIKYENMVRDMDGTLISLSSFFGISLSNLKKDDLLPEGFQSTDKNEFFQKLPPDVRTEVFNKIKSAHNNLSAPVNTGNIEKWKKEMSPYAVAVTEIITEKRAKKYGYEIEPQKNNTIKVSKYLLFKSRIVYFCWEVYTRWRYSNFSYNTKYRAKLIRNIINKGKDK
jgi:protein-tyrosine sulfotransferase